MSGDLFDDSPSSDLLGEGWGSAPFTVERELELQVDRKTGEIIDAELIEPEDAPPVRERLRVADSAAEIELLPLVFAEDGERAVELFRDPDSVLTLTRDATSSLLERIRDLAARQRAKRPEGEQSGSTLAPEITLMADAHDTLRAVESVFRAGAVEAREISGELAREIAPDLRKSSSVKVGDAHGSDVKLTRTVQTQMRVDEGEIIDVLVASLIARRAREPQMGLRVELTSDDTLRAFAEGARFAIERYRDLAAAHTFKSTTLDAFVRELEGSGDDALAIRLGHAYGRVSSGETVKLERVERKR